MSPINSEGISRTVYKLARKVDNLSLRLLDLGVIVVSWVVGMVAGFESPSSLASGRVLSVLLVAVVVQVIAHHVGGLYGPVWRYASVEEAVGVVLAVVGGAVAASVAIAILGVAIDTQVSLLTAPVIAVLLMLLGCGGIRFQARLFALERQQARESGGVRTLIVGAGTEGAHLAYELANTGSGNEVDVVGFVDDDAGLGGRSVRGFRVLGTTDQLEALCTAHEVARILITPTGDPSADTKAIVRRALRTSAQVKMLAPAAQRVQGSLMHSIRDLDVTDLLGRQHAPVDSEEIGDYLRGATVLITGAGGSIGSEVARQVATFEPKRLLLLDRDESLLHDTCVGPLADADPVLADIRDSARIDRIFEEHRPDVVFHAAALKHVPVLELYPSEAVRTNVIGTWDLARAAARHGCSRFVHISTDKAADPCSVMGATKRAAEQIVFEIGRRYDVPFVAVRFGNVLGSRGSVVPTFLRQILDGGPVTVTSPEMTRYFMTIPEAVSLVLQSGAMIDDGARIFLLEMGEPVPILGLARQMIRLAGLRPGDDIEIKITGARPGERLHERLHDDAEVIEPGGHPAIDALTPRANWRWDDLKDVIEGLSKSVDAESDECLVARLEAMLKQGGVECQLWADRPSVALGRESDQRS